MSSPAPTPDLHTGFSAPDAIATPWEDVVDVLVAAELFWISTVRTDGRPHVTPLPAVWRDGALYFCTGPGEQKALNLRANNECALTTGNNRWNAGLAIYLYYEDHPPPHIHARYADHEAKVDIVSGEIIEGSLPRRAARLVAEWVAEHAAELATCWDRATSGEQPGSIDPLQ